MRKVVFTLIILSCSAWSYAFECDELEGSWRGNLDKLTNVNLYIHANDGMETANISFNSPDGSRTEFGLLVGACQKNPDGSVIMNLTRDSYGVRSAMNLQLTNQQTVNVSYFSYSYPWGGAAGSGFLSK